MLEPNGRTLLLDCLKPPNGFELDEAVGTTYTLDLYALLGVPVAFVFRDATAGDGGLDPLATLEALRRNAARIHLFCQAGAIQVPRGQERLFAFVEECVHPVMPATEDGVFHPKAWVLRFTDRGGKVAYRLVCLSRNLTFDRSWDTVLVLDGLLEQTAVREPDPRPLAAFLRTLPALVTRPLGERARAAIERMAAELPRVRFEPPPGVETLRFWPIGVPGHEAPQFTPARRPLLVVSPFLSPDWLQRQVDADREAYLVSREDQLLALPADTLAHFRERYTLLPEATPEEDVEAQGEDEDLLDGLHAKLFVMDGGWNAHVWTGSANATSAAFRQNVELLVELIGKKSQLGIAALLGESDGRPGFRDLLERWCPPEGEVERADPVEERLQERLRAAQRALASAALQIAVHAAADQAGYTWSVEGAWPALPSEVTGILWPVGLDRGRGSPITGVDIELEHLTLEGISAFVAVELSASEAGKSQSTRFVLKLPMHGAPADRDNQLLRSMLQEPRAFMRLLMLLLADSGIEALTASGTSGADWETGGWLPAGGDAPLLESLLKALDRTPERLDQIKRLLDDLSDGGELSAILPEGFLDVWEAIWANRGKAGGHG